MTLCRKCGKEIPDGEELCQDCLDLEENMSDEYLNELMQSMENELSELGVEEPVAEEPENEDGFSLEEEPMSMPEEELMTEEPEPMPMPEEELMTEEPEPMPMPEEEPMTEEPEPMPEEEPMTEEPEPMPEEEPEPMPEEEPVAEEPVPEEEPESEKNEEDDIDALLSMLSQDFEEKEEESQPEEIPSEGVEVQPVDESPIEASLFSEEDDDGGIFADDADSLSVNDIFGDALSAVDYEEGEEEPEEEVVEEFISPEDTMEDLALDEAMVLDDSEIPDLDVEMGTTPIAKPLEKKEKKNSVWRRLFGNIITEQTAEEEKQEREAEQASAEEKAAAKAEKKQQLAAEKEEKAELAQEEKEKKAAEKAEKAAVKAAEKDEKKRLKMEAAANEVVGKINPVGASIVMVFFGLICVAAILGSQMLSHSSSVSGAESSFEERDYRDAYQSLAGVTVSEDSDAYEMKDKIRICMQLQRELDAYGNYYKMKMYLESLDSLMKGIRSYDENHSKAERYDIISQYNELEIKLAEQLYQEFGVSESQARSINAIEGQVEYTSRLQDIIAKWEQRNKEDER